MSIWAIRLDWIRHAPTTVYYSIIYYYTLYRMAGYRHLGDVNSLYKTLFRWLCVSVRLG